MARLCILALIPLLVGQAPEGGGQDGAVFLWTCAGRPEAIGTIFTQTAADGRLEIIHELHSLSLSTLDVQRPGALTPIPGAPAPASSPARRLVQMRGLSEAPVGAK